MQPIPLPELLDPDRQLRNDRADVANDDDRTRAELLDTALHDSCRYAQQLWQELDTTRAYLLESLPPDPREPGDHTRTATAPAGPDDEDGWNAWMERFAAVTSALCGPHGDSGFGLGRARQEAQRRRTAPVLTVHAVQDSPAVSGPVPDEPPRRGRLLAGQARPIALTALFLLAVRGLRPGRR
jgi:hypothetical protein